MHFKISFIFFINFTLLACGGSSNSETTPQTQVTTPQIQKEQPLYGHLSFNLNQTEKRHLFLSPEISYLYDNTSSETPPTELVCVSNDPLEIFTDTLTTQTLIFNCDGRSETRVYLTLDVGTEVQLTYDGILSESLAIEFEDIVELDNPQIKALGLMSSMLNITERAITEHYSKDFFMGTFTRTANGPRLFKFIIRSIDWLENGNCTVGYEYDTRIDFIQVNTINETANLLPYGIVEQPSTGTCENAILPMPTSPQLGYTLQADMYTLSDESFFIALKQGNEFLSVGRLLKN